jgi:hypothetical protein
MAGKKVLVVDDDAKTVKLVKLYLEREGFETLIAYDGIEALNLARTGSPDLIVLDLMLPDLDGFEVCRTLRHESDVPDDRPGQVDRLGFGCGRLCDQAVQPQGTGCQGAGGAEASSRRAWS